MGEYFCRVCNLFDDGGIDKQFFHCDDCGICRCVASHLSLYLHITLQALES